ncbi:MAG: hypothetical protein R3C19_23150 [Planctomycetaceae bacterium]
MTKEDFRNWLVKKIETQQKLTIGASAAMAVLGLLAFVVQGGILYWLVSFGYGRTTGAMVILGLFGGMGVFTFLTAPGKLRDGEFEANTPDGSITVRVAPTMSAAWTFAMGSLESDQSWPERIFGLLMLVPRLIWTAWYMYGRIEQVRQIDINACAAVLRLLFKKSEKVSVETIAEKRSGTDLTKTLREVSLIDGVVFLTKRDVGISIAPRLSEDLAKWREKLGESSEAPSSPFAD